MEPTGSITRLLERWEGGSRDALDSVVEQAYEKLSQQARSMMRNERSSHTLQTRGLVNETYIRLLDSCRNDWKDRSHFYAVAALIMRRVLVDHARGRQSLKRGSGVIHVTLDRCEENITDSSAPGAVDVLAQNSAMSGLEQIDPIQARVVELRYFGGLTVAQVAKSLNLSPATVKRKWKLAQAWLYRELAEVQ